MTPERNELVNDLADRALEIPEADRAAWLIAECGTDEELLNDVWRFIAADSGPDPAKLLAAALEESERPLEPGTRIGQYEVLEEIGRGGMGVVYRAKRIHGETQVVYALKLLDPLSLDEIRNLAALEHRNIARFYDAGHTEGGEPYLVMEYVEGKPIDEYCRRRNLTIRQRVGLAMKVAEALSYAHGRMVIHRDLKPSNLFVKDAGEPKLLDFGISKGLRPEDAKTPGRGWTPAYASPEQARGERVATATDIYSLGMVLCEMLCGKLPYLTTRTALNDIANFVQQVIPEAPSNLVEKPALRKLLVGELDPIVRKAIEKKPSKRYASMAAMAADLRNYLDGSPVMAHGMGRRYRLSKFIRKYPAGALASVALAGTLAFTAAQAGRIISRDLPALRAADGAAEARDYEAILGVVEFALDQQRDAATNRAAGKVLDKAWSDSMYQLYIGRISQLSSQDLRLAAILWKFGEIRRGAENDSGAAESFRQASEVASAGWAILRAPANLLRSVNRLPSWYPDLQFQPRELLGDIHMSTAELGGKNRTEELKSALDEYWWAERAAKDGPKREEIRNKRNQADRLLLGK